VKNVLFALLIPILLSACGSASEWPPKPAAVHLGEDSCAACKMIISEERYGAQLHQPGKPVQRFDDFGCLLAQNYPSTGKHVIYVRSSEDGSWLVDDQAVFVVSKQISSPMGYGISAFATKESASKYAEQFGDSKIYSITELVHDAGRILGEASPEEE
jgi:copper chaperone NosL